jgi:hypothetical protein
MTSEAEPALPFLVSGPSVIVSVMGCGKARVMG